MDGLSSYLSKFRRILGDKGREKELIQEAILLHTQITVPLEAISLNNQEILLSVSPTYRTEIMMKKKKVLETLKEKELFLNGLR